MGKDDNKDLEEEALQENIKKIMSNPKKVVIVTNRGFNLAKYKNGEIDIKKTMNEYRMDTEGMDVDDNIFMRSLYAIILKSPETFDFEMTRRKPIYIMKNCSFFYEDNGEEGPCFFYDNFLLTDFPDNSFFIDCRFKMNDIDCNIIKPSKYGSRKNICDAKKVTNINFYNCDFVASHFEGPFSKTFFYDCRFRQNEDGKRCCDFGDAFFDIHKTEKGIIKTCSFLHCDINNTNFCIDGQLGLEFYNYDEEVKNELPFTFKKMSEKPSSRCPIEGPFIAYKVVNTGYGVIMAKLFIPEDAKRINPLNQNKCRSDKAKVLGFYSLCAGKTTNVSKEIEEMGGAESVFNPYFTYHVGQMAVADDFNDHPLEECGEGINFYMSVEEVEEAAEMIEPRTMKSKIENEK